MTSIFSPLPLKRLTLPTRILRAATFENMADPSGCVGERHGALYEALAKGGVGTIITGFSYVSRQGRALQPFQAGIAGEEHVEAWKHVIERVKKADPSCKIILQIAHTGRQTGRKATGQAVVGAGPVRCTYFLSRVHTLTEPEVAAQARVFGEACKRAARAGFDAVQIHSAHGYLIHQFLSPYTNRRHDKYGEDRALFLKEVLREARSQTSIPIILKMSGSEDRLRAITPDLTSAYIRQIEPLNIVDAVEISYGTMEIAFNIMRGGHPLEPVLRHNHLFTRFGPAFLWLFKNIIFHWYKRRFLSFSPMYNLENAVAIKKKTNSAIPLLVTGGIRSGGQIQEILDKHCLDGVTLCRPFICEPDIVAKFRSDPRAKSLCTSCNLCTVNCDSQNPLRCYRTGKENLTDHLTSSNE
ncbi:MAG: NADH:flavin oxidoreductase [Candidatus Ozemobacteraceae bacterium]